MRLVETWLVDPKALDAETAARFAALGPKVHARVIFPVSQLGRRVEAEICEASVSPRCVKITVRD